MKQVIFITATDTDAGKTTVALQLLKRYAEAGFKTAALKPISCGAHLTHQGWRNTDAELLQAAATLKQPYQSINPFIFSAPCSPNIAAEKQSARVTVDDLMQAIQDGMTWDVDYLLIEGCGGWYVPLNEYETLADWVKLAKIPVLLVVGVRLGCLNHAILTARALQEDQVNCIGWIANCCDPSYGYVEETIKTLQQYLPWSLLECVEYQQTDISVCA